MDATPIPDDEPTDDEVAAEIEAMEAAIDEPDDDGDEPDPIPEPDWSERANWLDSLTKFIEKADGLDHPGAGLTVGVALCEIRRILERLR